MSSHPVMKNYNMVSEVGPVRRVRVGDGRRPAATGDGMMEQFKLPSPLVMTGNLEENWRRWKQRFQINMTASGAEGKDEKIMVAILLHTL